MRAAWVDTPWVTAVFALAAAILTWSPLLVVPGPGLDASWILALNLGAEMGLDHGTEFVFTYGPLGFLAEPLALDGLLATSGALYLLGLRAALAASLLICARRSLPWIAAAPAALAVVMITPRAIVPLALATVWAIAALQVQPPRWSRGLLLWGGGALAALELLIKLNVGITILLVVALATLALPGRRARNLGTPAAVFTASFALLWLVAGQGIGNVGDYLSSSVQVVSGYSEALQTEAPKASWDWLAALLAGVASLAAAVSTGRRLPRIRLAALTAIAALLAFALFKYGFVRHDAGHVGALFGGLAAIWLALRWEGLARLVPCVAIAALVLVSATASDELSGGAFRPRVAVDQLRLLLDPGRREAAVDAARANLQASYALDPAIVERIGDAPVDVRPWEIAIAWAYEMQWRPLPVIQDYQAYTPELDTINAEALSSEDGPRFVLRHVGFGGSPAIGLDGRYTPFDAPRQTLTLLCEFRAAETTAGYQLLERSSNRCGEPRELGTASAAYGEPLEVPAARPDEAIVAMIEGAAAQGVERLRTFAYRAAVRRIALDDRGALLTPRNAESGLLLVAPPKADFPAPFALAPNPSEVAIESTGGFATSSGPLEVRFLAVPLD